MYATRMFELFAFLVFSCISHSSVAQDIVVDITDGDAIDIDPEFGTILDLPGPDGHISFSEAMIASNNTPGRQWIKFAIPQTEWTYLPWFYPGRAVITGMMLYASAYDPVVIDGSSQTAFTGDTNPDGNEVVILRGGGLYLAANDCIVLGLDRTNLAVEGADCLIQDNSEMGIDLYRSHGNLIKDNRGGGYVFLDQSNENIILGNELDRIRITGWAAGGFPATRNRIGGPTLGERNFVRGNGFQSSQGIPSGYALQLFDTAETIVENNWIGTTFDGLGSGNPYTTIGVWLDSENRSVEIKDNLIAGIKAIALPPHAPSYYVGTAILVGGTGFDLKIAGNKIGLDAKGRPILGSVTGIDLINYYLGVIQDISIGGASRSESNEIAGQDGTAIRVGNGYSGVRILGNSIHDNGGLGIDLIAADYTYGVSLNDPGDTDGGANDLQNFPVLEVATQLPAPSGRWPQLRVAGTINSQPNATIVIEVFASPRGDESGYGEGRYFVGMTTVTTDAKGWASFAITSIRKSRFRSGWVATATASFNGSTSEFSEYIPITIQ